MDTGHAAVGLGLSAGSAHAGTPAHQRLISLFDDGTFVEIAAQLKQDDEFADLVCGYGCIQGYYAYGFAQHGALNRAQVQKMRRIYDLALQNGAPIIGFYSSPGVTMEESSTVFDSCGELLALQNRLSGVVPQIAVVVGPCIGTNGVLACSADYVIMTEAAVFFSVPPTADLSDDVASALSVAQAGVAHITTKTDDEAVWAAQKLVSLLPQNNLDALPASDYDEVAAAEEYLATSAKNIAEAEIPQIVRHIIDKDSDIELFAEFGTGVYTTFATLAGQPVGIVATRGGQLAVDDCVKIARVVSVWDSFGIPIVNLIHITGMLPQGAAAARAAAKLVHVYAQATVPKIALVVGNAYGSGYIALAGKAVGSDYVAAWSGAVISPLAPRTAVAFLEGGRIGRDKTREQLEEEYCLQVASATSAAQAGLVDALIEPEETRKVLLSVLGLLAAKRVEKLPKKHGNIPF